PARSSSGRPAGGRSRRGGWSERYRVSRPSCPIPEYVRNPPSVKDRRSSCPALDDACGPRVQNRRERKVRGQRRNLVQARCCRGASASVGRMPLAHTGRGFGSTEIMRSSGSRVARSVFKTARLLAFLVPVSIQSSYLFRQADGWLFENFSLFSAVSRP